MSAIAGKPATRLGTGLGLSPAVPFPSAPIKLLPHAHTLPSVLSASACMDAETLTTLAKVPTPSGPTTGAGNDRWEVLPSPNTPDPFWPQAHSEPSRLIAKLSALLAATEATSDRTPEPPGARTRNGLCRSDPLVPSPSSP